MSAVDPTLRAFKTNAWQAAEAVEVYAERVGENVGVNRLKNAVETALIARWVSGTDVIDVGIGTGRASIPLARAGLRVTGVDASAAMLERARRDAEPARITVLRGDIEALPVPDGAFDTLVSLNVAEHFPHWRAYLREWKRVLRPGGRMIFDLHSLDHVEAVSALTGTPVDALLAGESTPATFLTRVRWRDLAAYCDEAGLAVEALIPHGLFYSTFGISFALGDGLARGERLERMLSYVAVDERLFAFGRFLHEQLVAQLTPRATGALMVVLRNASDRAATAAVARRIEELDAVFAQGPTFAALAPYLDLPADEWRRRASAHLTHDPNVIFAALFLTAMPLDWATPELFDEALGPALGGRLRALRRLHAIDRAVEQLGAEWYDPTVTHHGVPLGAIARYAVTQELLAPSAELRASALE